jgi:hypothetical protein
MTVWNKQGVLGNLQPIAQKGFGRVAAQYTREGQDIYVTSIREGNHKAGSLHYLGLAFDIKRGKVSKFMIQTALGAGWDVLEYPELNIFHCEYDPK